MKKTTILLTAIIMCFVSSYAQYNSGNGYGVNSNSTYVHGYTKSNGTYVQEHYRSSKNSTNHDNYSTSGNVNPHNGRSGSRAKDYSTRAKRYGSGQTIYTGPRGGQYYINSNGNKTYVPKRR